MIFAHYTEGIRARSSSNEKLFRFSDRSKLKSRVPGRYKCTDWCDWSKFSAFSVSIPDLGRPDAVEGDNMLVRELRLRLTTCKQPWSTIGARQMPISRFCAPRRRQPHTRRRGGTSPLPPLHTILNQRRKEKPPKSRFAMTMAEACPDMVQVISISIFALEQKKYHLETPPECDFMPSNVF